MVTRDEERNLGACLASVTPCGEILVADSGSTDGTRRVAEEFGAVWLEREWDGFAGQRRFAAGRATREFVLFLDADEWLSPALRTEIAARIQSGEAGRAVLAFKRVSDFLGRTIRHGDWSRDWVARFAPRGAADWKGAEPHPRLESPTLPEVRCLGPLRHRPYPAMADFERKIADYARIWAEGAARRGERAASWAGWPRAAWRWVRGGLLRGGFLDGRAGWIIAWQNARMVVLKYLYLSRLGRTRQSGACH